jgi:hypothetical protein
LVKIGLKNAFGVVACLKKVIKECIARSKINKKIGGDKFEKCNLPGLRAEYWTRKMVQGSDGDAHKVQTQEGKVEKRRHVRQQRGPRERTQDTRQSLQEEKVIE